MNILANKSEKERAWEIQMMSMKIRPLGGYSTGVTRTAGDIAKSWLDHEPLWNIFCEAIQQNSNLIHVSKKNEEYPYYEEKYQEAVNEFWTLNAEIFNEEHVKRPLYDQK